MSALHWDDYIEERKEVLLGKPIFKGTRLSVELVLKALGAGSTIEELLEQYPTLRANHIEAAIVFDSIHERPMVQYSDEPDL